MKYKNPHYRKVRNSQLWIISCDNCKKDLFKYQKVGIGSLQRMLINRIVEGEIDLSNPPKNLICTNCKTNLATRIHINKGDREVYRMKTSTFSTRKADY